MATITWEELRKAVLRETTLGKGPDFGVYATTTRATTTITVPRVANSNLTVDEFMQCWGFLPDHATADDRERPLGAVVVATGVISNGGRVFSGTSASPEQFEIMEFLSPSQLFETCVEQMKQLPQTVMLPLGTFADSDMETAGVSNWTASNTSLSKVTTAANVFTGTQSLFINNTGANGYAESPAVNVNPGKSVYVAAILRADAGTASLVLYDNTAGAEFSATAPTYTGERFAHIWRQETVPADCESITVRVVGSGASDDIYVDSIIGPYIINSDFNVDAPSWMDETWRLRKIRSASYRQGLARQVEDAASRTFTDWMLGEDVKFNIIPNAAHPYRLGLRQLYDSRDLWYEGVRRAYDLTSTTFANTAAGEAYTTSLPREQVILSCSLAVCDRVIDAYRDSADRVRVARDRIAKRLAAWQSAQELELPAERYVVQSGYGRV
jgi:hypothetical protein